MPPKTRHGAQSSKNRLAFRDRLAGKGITADTLLKKLQTLHTQLAALDQDNVDVASLSTARTELIDRSLLLHKERGVKAYTACCLADILRLYAPEAPYTQNELRDIFQFFFRQLSAGLKGQEEPYFNEYFHLLESLSTVKSVVLVCDLPSADELLHDIFKDLFNIVKRDLPSKVERFIADILAALIDECSSFPADALEVLMAQFIEKNARPEQPGYRLATQVCNAAADKLQRHVCQYFGDLVTSTSEEDAEEDLDNMRTSHELVKRLHRSCPAVLHSVIPILETELRADGLNARLIATQTLGEMYADKGGPELVRKYPSTWQAWINRKSDISVAVRLKCVEAVPALLAKLPESRESLDELLKAKIYDPDEKVRTAACKVYFHLDYESALHHVSEEQLHRVVERGLDKKASVRTQALNSIGRLYSLAYPEIENNEPMAVKQFRWIPEEVLSIATTTETRGLVEQVLFDYILPLPSISTSSATREKDVDEVAWTDRLLSVMRTLTPKTSTLLLSLSGLKTSRPNVYDHYLESCVKNNGGIIDKDEEIIVNRLKNTSQYLAASFVDTFKANEDLLAFAKLNENRLFKLLKTCMDPQTDLKTLIKSSNEFLKRLEQLSPSIVPTMTAILRRSSYGIVNQSSIPTLFKRLEKGNQEGASGKARYAANNAQSILLAISKHCPALFKSHIAELSKAIADESKTQLVEVALMALANVVKWDEKLGASVDKKTNERIVKLALSSNWRHAKFAARYLAFSKNKNTSCSQVIESIATNIESDEPELPVAQIAALVQLVKFAPDAFEQKSDVIITYLIKRVLMVPSPADPNEEDSEEEWIENDEIPDELRAKVLAVKVCRNRCLSHAASEQALEIATPVLKLLATLLEHDGSLSLQVEENPKFKSRLRLQAAISLLHLCTIETFSTAISPKFVRLACVIQDSCFNVRLAFLTKLISFLHPRKLSPRFNVIPMLTVLDPEPDTKTMAAQYVENIKRRMTKEIIFIRLLHLLAHHPDFGTSQDELLDMATYIQFYLDLVATADNIPLLFHIAQKGKTVRDPESHARSENFYVLCEMAQFLVKARANANSWPMDSNPYKIRLPSDILRALPSVEATNQILKTTYLPAEATRWMSERFKLGGAKEKKEKKEKVPAKRKAPPTKSNGHSKRSKKRRSDEDEDDEEDDGGEESAADSDVEMANGTTPTRAGRARKSDASEDTRQQTRAERLSARIQAKERLSTKGKKAGSPSEDEDG
ncbi:Sister chromatid cohesion protein pds5 [Psilocybe cubensis]|uniref:Sister chromatid cohesion protein pds5 n=1 Tax=Psilocybe cubensis TaxID=181762 RepID=A0ACB8GQW3_PSICU|nr:Sister chromatid cohesion protein pds5 [Psilocybe cubensis]KAH9477762.1 Sister chromatid cohesion protein pds5 [Psilocybe cubensis]